MLVLTGCTYRWWNPINWVVFQQALVKAQQKLVTVIAACETC